MCELIENGSIDCAKRVKKCEKCSSKYLVDTTGVNASFVYGFTITVLIN